MRPRSFAERDGFHSNYKVGGGRGGGERSFYFVKKQQPRTSHPYGAGMERHAGGPRIRFDNGYHSYCCYSNHSLRPSRRTDVSYHEVGPSESLRCPNVATITAGVSHHAPNTTRGVRMSAFTHTYRRAVHVSTGVIDTPWVGAIHSCTPDELWSWL